MSNDIKHKKILEVVRNKLTCSAHNLDHVMRVYNMSLKLAEYEKGVDMDILIPASLLHDIARVEESKDVTGEVDHAVLGSEIAGDILRSLDYDDEKIGKIKHCIVTHRFRTGNEPNTIEAKILFDADKLDAIGAVGIARTFMLSGQCGQKLALNDSIDDYLDDNIVENGRIKDMSKHTAFIEYEVKLKNVPNKLYTQKAKEIGNERVKFMDEFFERLKNDIKGVD